MPASSKRPNTIVLVHGFWVTPRSWEHWITHYEAKGYRVLAPAYPGFEVEVEALNDDPTPVERLTVPAIIEHLKSIVGALDTPAILMGHSAGGTFVQILLDQGFGAAGVTFNSAPTEGVLVAPWSQIRALFPVLKSPANRHRVVGLTYEQWRYTFANTFPEDEARASYKRYHVPASGGLVWDSALANLEAWAARDLGRLPQRAATPAAVHLGRRGPPDAAGRAALERGALHRGDAHRGEGVRGALSPAACAARLGGNRRLRALVGRAARGLTRRTRRLTGARP